MAEEQIHLDVILDKPQKKINEPKRFFLVILGSFGCICASFVHGFNLISGDMQKLLGLSQRDLSSISVVGKVFAYCLLPYAFLYDFAGPIPVTLFAMLFFILGCVLLALCFSEDIKGSVARLCVFNAILGSGTMLFDLAAIVTVSAHFPNMRGATIALLKSFTGLGTSIFGTVRLGFFQKHTDHFYYFLAAYSGLVGISYLVFMRLPPYHLTSIMERRLSPEEKEERLSTKAQYLRQTPPRWRYYVGYTFLITLIIFLPTQSALVAYLKLGSKFKIAFAIVSIILTAAMCLVFIPDPSRLFKRKKNRRDDYVDQDTQEENEVGMDDVDDLDLDPTENKGVKTEVDYIAPQYQESFLHNLLTLRLWCLIWTLFCLTGTEYIIILNSSYIFGALAGEVVDDNLRSLLSVLNGAGSAVGRLLMAAFEHWTQHRPPEKRIPFPWACLAPTSLLILSLVLFLVLPGPALPLPYVLVALANGGQATLTVLIPRTIYGKDAAKHYNFCFVASVLSCIILVRFLYGEWYTVQAEKQLAAGITTEDDQGYCFGKSCLLMPFCTLIGLVCSSVLTTLYLSIKYSRYCKRALAERRRILDECAGGNTAYNDGNDAFVDEIKSKDQAPEAEEVEPTKDDEKHP